MKTLLGLWDTHLRTVLFAGLGSLVGLAYYETIGCRSGGT